MEEEDTTSSTVPATSFRSAAGACSFRMDGNNNNNGDSERRRVLERNTSPSFCRRSQNFSESSLSQSIRQLHIQEAEEVLKDDPNDSTPPLERPANYRDFLKASRNRRSSIDQEVLIRVQKQQQEEERQKRQSRRRRSSTSSSNNNKQNHKNFMQRNEDNILGNGGTKGDVVVGIEEGGDDDDDDDEEEGKETPQPNEYVTTSKAQQAHAQQTADDTKDMRRMYRTMSVMNGRFMKTEDAAAWESMVHELATKMKKMDADGLFKGKKTKNIIPWYSPPIQRQRWDDDANTMLPIINYGTLFFDLFFVAAMYNLGELVLSAVNQPHQAVRVIIYFIGIFGPMFVTWETDVYYQSRYCVADYAHRLFEVLRFVCITAAVLFIRPMNELSNPQDHVAPFILTLAICLESFMHLLLNVELYYKAQGDRNAIQNHSLRKLQKQLIPTTLTYFVGALTAAVFYFLPNNNDFYSVGNSGYWNVTDLPLTVMAGGYLSNIAFTIWRKLRATTGTVDIRQTYVPNNIDFLIGRYADWFLLLLGEVVMAMVETTDSKPNYFVASMGALTTIVLHTLKFESEPQNVHGHALWRNLNNATCFSLLMQFLSIGMVCLGVSYKALLTDGRYGVPDRYASLFVCVALAWVLIALELLVITHKGLRKTLERLFHTTEVSPDDPVIHWAIVALNVFKLGLFGLLLTLPAYVNDPSFTVLTGFFVVVAIAMTRIVGWALIFHEAEIQKLLHSTKKVLKSKVSFAAMSISRHSRSNGSLGTAESDRDLNEAMETGSVSSHGSFSSKQKREEVYDEMFDAVVLTDLKGYIVTVNQTCLDVFLYKQKSDLIGQNVSLLVGGDDAKHHDAYLEAFHRNDKQTSQIGKQRVLHAKRQDGTEFPCIVGIKRSKNNKYLVGYIRNMEGITDLSTTPKVIISNIDDMLSDEQRHMNKFLDDKAFDSIVMIDLSGTIQGVNATFLEDFGYDTKEEIVGQSVNVLMGGRMHGGGETGDDHHDAYLQRYRERRTHGETMSKVLGNQRMLTAQRKDGTEFQCIIGVHDVEETELLVGYIRNVDKLMTERSSSISQRNNPRRSGSCSKQRLSTSQGFSPAWSRPSFLSTFSTLNRPGSIVESEPPDSLQEEEPTDSDDVSA